MLEGTYVLSSSSEISKSHTFLSPAKLLIANMYCIIVECKC